MKKLFLLSIAALAFANCSNELDTEIQNLSEKEVITAQIPEGMSRTTTKALKVLWAEGDQIGVFRTKSEAEPETFVNNCFTLSNGAGTVGASFTAEKASGVDNVFAYYPYNVGAGFSGSNMTITLPAEQNYDDGNQLVMVGEFEEGSSAVSFKNAMALAVITVKNIPANYSKAVLTASDEEYLAGTAKASIGDNGATLTISRGSSKTLTINFGDNVETEKRFYFAIPTGTYANGLTMTLEGEDVNPFKVGTLKDAANTTEFTPEVNEFFYHNIELNAGVTTTQEVSTEEGLNAAFENGGSIKLTADIVLTKSLSSTKDVTLDLAGKSITPSSSFNTDALIVAKYGATLTINNSEGNGSLNANGNAKVYAAVKLTEKGDVAEEGQVAKLVVNGGTLTGTYYGISGNGDRPGTEVEINGGTITSTADDGLGIYHPQDGTITIINGTITGAMSAIEMRAGTLNIKGGNFTATSSEFSSKSNGSGNTISGAAVAVSKYNAKSDLTVTIDAGTFNGIYALYEEYLETEPMPGNLSLAVNDGTFNGLVYSENCSNAFESITVKASMSKTMNLNGETFDGGYGTLNVDLSATSGSVAKAFSVTGGTIQNLTIDCGYEKNSDGNSSRGIYIENATKDVILKNVTIKGVGYTMNTGSNIANGLKLSVSNSTLIGWTSYDKFASAEFKNCYFGIGTNYEAGSISNGNFKPYVTTTLEDCTFEKGFGLDFSALVDGATVTFKNCKVKVSETETIDLSVDDTENIVWDTYSSSKVTIE